MKTIHKLLMITNFIMLQLVIALTLCLSGCAQEAIYRGVPESQWAKLTAEEKQLIIDQSYEEEINGIK